VNISEIIYLLIVGYPVPQSFINPIYPQWVQSIGGLQLTLIITLFAVVFSFIPGICFAGIKEMNTEQINRTSVLHFWVIIIKTFLSGIIMIIRACPLMVLILLVFTLPYPLFGLRIPLVIRAVIAMTIYSSVYMAQIFSSGLCAVKNESIEAAKVLGISKLKIFIHIQLPVAFRVMIPALLGLIITVFKDSSILMVVGVGELTFTAKQITVSQPVNYFLLLLIVVLMYWFVSTIGSIFVKTLEKRWNVKSKIFNEDLL
jgi:ABC-type amino acid transport system permease subunit